MFQFVKIVVLFVSVQMLVNTAFAQCNLTFSGKITDDDTHANLEAATITLVDIKQTTQTNKDGKFEFRGLCAGHYDVLITHTSCEPLQTHIHITDDYETEYRLPHEKLLLEAVSVQSNTVKTNGLKSTQLEQQAGASLGETLKKINGVSALQTGTNVYKPVVNGLHSSRVVILNNGIRQEGQQWGSEHAPEIDTYLANNINLVKGAQTLRYGGDGIGGIILVEPKLLSSKPGIQANLQTAVFSNNRMGALSAIVDGNLKKQPKLSWRLQGTLKKAGNARTRNYWLDNSGLEEMNMSAAIGYAGKKWQSDIFYSFFSTKLAVFSGSHIGNVTDLLNAINSAEPPSYIKDVPFTYTINRPYQQVQHHLLKLRNSIAFRNAKLQMLTAVQYNDRNEFDKKRFASSSNSPQLSLGLFTVSNDLVLDHYSGKRLKGSIGMVTSYQNNSYAQRFFIPNYQAVNVALFAIEKYKWQKFTAEAGLRFDYRYFFNTTNNSGKQFDNRTYNSVTYNGGISYKPNNSVQFGLQLASAWRAPNVNELYSSGLHHGAARIEVGNAQLKPERANSISVEANVNKHKWQLNSNVYVKNISNFIYLQPSLGPQLTIRGAFPGFAYSQTNALLYGVDAQLQYELTHHIVATTKASILYAKNIKTKEWLIQMPSNKYEGELTYTFNNFKRFTQSYATINGSFVAQQNRIPKTGAIELTDASGSKYYAADYILPPNGYALLNISLGTQLKLVKRIVGVQLGCTNLLNAAYREYLNAFRYFADEMGRNISLRLKIPINN
jgi:iron complex outermembrane recepter protein